MPACIASCFTVNVLYTNRTRENMRLVVQSLQESVRQLLAAESGRTNLPPVESLARAQALLMYQIIRLFGGDIMQRAQGERDTELLLKWLSELCQVRDDSAECSDLERHTSWQSWLFDESVRRTIVMAYSVIGLYTLMTGSNLKGKASTFRINSIRCAANDVHPDGIDVWSLLHRWTLSRHLWEADSSVSFERARVEKPCYSITNYMFDDFLLLGNAEDVDEFAEILINA